MALSVAWPARPAAFTANRSRFDPGFRFGCHRRTGTNMPPAMLICVNWVHAAPPHMVGWSAQWWAQLRKGKQENENPTRDFDLGADLDQHSDRRHRSRYWLRR